MSNKSNKHVKKKQKKEKKILGVPVNFEFGDKIKDIKIDETKYRISNLACLIILNILLFAVMIYFLVVMHNVWTITIAIFTMITCLVWSISSYVLSVLKIKYTLYENAIVKNFDTSVNVGELNKLKSIKIGKSLLDKIGKIKTSTITIHFTNKWCSKIVLSCIDDNINEIAEQIIYFAGQAKQKLKENAQSNIDSFTEKKHKDSIERKSNKKYFRDKTLIKTMIKNQEKHNN